MSRHCVLLLALHSLGQLQAQDCDGNGILDSIETRLDLHFAEAELFSVGNRPTTIASADLNGDGLPDLVTTDTESNTLSVLLSSRTSPRFQRAVSYCVGVDPRGIGLGLIDDDDELDVVCGAESRPGDPDDPDDKVPRLRDILLRGLGDGSLTPDCVSPCEALLPSCREGDHIALVESADAIRTVILDDFDGDGRLDILNGIRDPVSRVSLLFGLGAGEFGAPVVPHLENLRASRYVATGDLNLDGALDIVTSGGEWIPGPFRPSDLPRSAISILDIAPDTKGVVVLDANGDGLLDIAVARTHTQLAGRGGGQVLVFMGDGSGNFQSLAQPALSELCDLLESLAVGDLDGDGDPDLVVTHFGGFAGEGCDVPGISVLQNDGAGRFSVAAFVAFEERRPRWTVLDDIDGDGWLDISIALDAPALALDEVAVLINETMPPPGDLNANGVLDVCEFFRGDVDADGRITISDPISILNYLFLARPVPACLEAADADDDGRVVLSDAVGLLLYSFQSGREPAAPGPPRAGCTWPARVDTNGLLPCEYSCRGE